MEASNYQVRLGVIRTSYPLGDEVFERRHLGEFRAILLAKLDGLLAPVTAPSLG
jgi:hypothetical protein